MVCTVIYFIYIYISLKVRSTDFIYNLVIWSILYATVDIYRYIDILNFMK